MLVFDEVHFYYHKDRPVTGNLSFTIEAGQFVAVVGANGCGKSTAARLMNGLLLPKRGSVSFNGLSTANPEELRRIREQIGFVFQNPEDQFITTSVMDEVIFGLENIRVPREDMRERAEAALRAVQMEDYADAMPHELSGGQKQRVAIAVILAMRPRLIIFDEATSMLDPEGRQRVLSIMQELHQQGITVVHITHQMDEVLSADRVLLLHEGRLAFDGTPLALFETVPLGGYQLEPPFAVRLHGMLQWNGPLLADWKEMLSSEWPMN